MTETAVSGVAEAIEERRRELGLSISDMIARAGVTAPALAPLRKGLPRNYAQRTLDGLCDSLRWKRGSIDKLFAGEVPDESWVVPLDGSAVLEALDKDPALTEEHRGLVRTVYLAAVEASQRGRS